MSSPIVLGSPFPPAPDPAGHPGWEYMEVTWTDATGKVWDLTRPELGVFLVRGGVRGLGFTKTTQYRQQSPAVSGSLYTGLTYESREVFWPIYLFHDGSTREFVQLDDDWWLGLDPDTEGTWTIKVPGVSTRSIKLRFRDDGDWSPEVDPTFYGWALYGITLQADQPHWVGETVYKSWGSTEPVPFFGGLTPGDPILRISNSRTISTASVTNRGDVDSYGIWTAHGPFSSTSITIGGHLIEIPFAVADGGWVKINTTPTELTVVDNTGADRIGDIGSFDPAPIPKRVETDITIVMTGGSGSIDLEFPLLYNKAWGLR